MWTLDVYSNWRQTGPSHHHNVGIMIKAVFWEHTEETLTKYSLARNNENDIAGREPGVLYIRKYFISHNIIFVSLEFIIHVI